MLKRNRQKHIVRVLNPERERKQRGTLVRVLNPGALGPLMNSPEAVFRDFRGREPQSVRLMEALPGTPASVAELGGLVEIVLSEESANEKPLRALKVKLTIEEAGEVVWKFNPERVKLVSDGRGKMHITGFYKPLPEELQTERAYFLGDVLRVTYKADKPHIEKGTFEYEHAFAEYWGQFPKLYFKDGFLFFRGGTYEILPNGIDG